jgi:hypothetical protein
MDGYKETIKPTVNEYIEACNEIGARYIAQQELVKDQQQLMNNLTGKKSIKVKKAEAIKETLDSIKVVMDGLDKERKELDATEIEVTITKELAQGTIELLEYLLSLNVLDVNGRV